jgi:putative ABC transport system permease protein
MWKNLFVVAFRHLSKNKLNAVIIILGLGTGIACSILSFLFILNELSFDRFHKNCDSIYEMKMVLALPMGRAIADPKSHIGPALVEKFPEVKRVVRLDKQKGVVRSGDEIFEEVALATESGFFDVFTFPLEQGKMNSLLRSVDSVVLTQRMARKYFGDENIVGRILSIQMTDEFQDYVVEGVLEEIPDSSSLQFDFMINLGSVYGASLNDPQKARSMGCFIQLEGHSQVEPLLEKFKTSIDKPLQEKYSRESGYDLQPFADFHLRGKYSSAVLSQKSTVSYSIILAGIALLVLVIACFNFMNLTIGRASVRTLEIGIRKVLGAKRKQLIQQFWLESLMYSSLSLAVGLVMAELFLPVFNRLSQKNLALNVFSYEWVIVFCFGAVLFVAIIAGSYPALFLSKFTSVDLFRGDLKLSRKNAFSRSLIVFQFSISIFLVVSTIFMYKQKTYMQSSDLGYDADRVVVLSLENLSFNKSRNAAFVKTLKNELLSYDVIQGVSGSAYDLAEGWMGTYFNKSDGEQDLVLYNYVDQDFLPTLGMELVAGRNFTDDFPSDFESSIIINESFARLLGTDSLLGRSLSEFYNTDFDRKIIGVVKDFHSQSLHDPILPSFVSMQGMAFSHVFIKLKEGSLPNAVASVKEEFRKLAPLTPFLYSFLDESVAKMYDREEHWLRMVEYACLFAILIACSGLFGLTLQIVFLRTKEIGIRKVLGASSRNIILLINKEFMWLVLASNIIAWPVSYLTMSAVLQNYAFRVSLEPWVFILAGFLALFLAAVTISFYTLQAARTNPSEILRYE